MALTSVHRSLLPLTLFALLSSSCTNCLPTYRSLDSQTLAAAQSPSQPPLVNQFQQDQDGNSSSSSGSSSSVPASFRPSIAVIVGVLTTMFSLTFLLLIYAKHCKRNPVGVFGSGGGVGDDVAMIMPGQQLLFRVDTGIDPAVVEALPTFSFSSLKGNKEGLECAVCLSKYEPRELLRLLPKCKHAFHVDCVDTWLASHSTCPLCRNRVTADDLLVVDEMLLLMLSSRRRSSISMDLLPAATAADQLQAASALAASAGQSRSSLDIDMGCGPAFQIYVQRPDQETAAAAAAPDQHGDADDDADGGVEHGAGGGGDEVMQRRLGHRIIVSDVVLQRRWSDLVPSDVLFLSNNTHALFWPSSSSSSSSRFNPDANCRPALLKRAVSLRGDTNNTSATNLNSQRCMSEMSGLDRFLSRGGKAAKDSLPMYTYDDHEVGGGHELPCDDQSASTRWSRIARSTLSWLVRRQSTAAPLAYTVQAKPVAATAAAELPTDNSSRV